MKKVFKIFLWNAFITLTIATFFFAVAAFIGTIFLWLVNENLLAFKWFMFQMLCLILTATLRYVVGKSCEKLSMEEDEILFYLLLLNLIVCFVFLIIDIIFNLANMVN
ncbi:MULTISPECIES: hypothetical protein [unclassified Enterococcus]|uniref:hypothetical protein n=1 Tax=unclassified Enterococcus TaxID=2608891 RepID=UPI0028FD755F|nr:MULTISPECIES: hypothetical protein [unclassified Enterococcus]MDU0320702.1 hypothetical protein [Enterococcus sp. 2STP]MDU0333895.1 hypothetical protein [Enterococcus sp. 2CBP]MDU0351126.1 hypothetical protein [Enterococcus sp. 3MOLP]